MLGNHDYAVGRGRYQFRTLGMPGPYYMRRLGDAQLFLLNSNAITDRQTAWLEKQLGVDLDLEDRRLPPPALHVRRSRR